MPESPGAWSPAKGTVGGQAAAVMAEPARSMRPQPSRTLHHHWRRYLGTQGNRAPLFSSARMQQMLLAQAPIPAHEMGSAGGAEAGVGLAVMGERGT